MPYPARPVPSLPADNVGIFICVPKTFIPTLRAALWGLQFRYGWLGNPPPEVLEIGRQIVASIDSNCCDVIITCVDQEATQQALFQAFLTVLRNGNSVELVQALRAGGFPIAPWVNSETFEPVADFAQPVNPALPPPPTCNFDRLYGQCVSVVNVLVDSVLGFITNLNVEAQSLNNLNRVIQAIPFVGGIADVVAADDLLTIKDWLTENVLESFRAFDSPLARGGLACEIFNIVRCDGRCSISWAHINLALVDDYVNTLGFTPDAAWELINSIFLGSISGEVAYRTLIAIAAFVIEKGSSFANLGRLSLPLAIGLGNDEPSGDWQFLCQPCGGTVSITFENLNGFTITQGVLDTTTGNPLPSLRALRIVSGGTVIYDSSVRLDTAVPAALVELDVFYTRSSGTAVAIELILGGVIVTQKIFTPGLSAWHTLSIAPPTGALVDTVRVFWSSASSATTGALLVDNIRIT